MLLEESIDTVAGTDRASSEISAADNVAGSSNGVLQDVPTYSYSQLLNRVSHSILQNNPSHLIEKPKSQLGKQSPLLASFLGCTLRVQSPVRILRGHSHVLRMIWELVCGEWWELHIERFPMPHLVPPILIPQLLHGSLQLCENYPSDRKRFAGCPVAVVAEHVPFPPPAVVPLHTFANQQSTELYVNMMPFDVYQMETLPACCRQYWPMIRACFPLHSIFHARSGVGFLTIDERAVPQGDSQRRRGLHVESPGVMPLIAQSPGEDLSKAPYSIATANGSFIPGAEHYWGNGLMMRGEVFQGGIYMASNMANTTAVWNCTINDEGGEFIGAHGDIEHLRTLLGKIDMLLHSIAYG